MTKPNKRRDYLSVMPSAYNLHCGKAVVFECFRNGQRGWMLPGCEFTTSRLRAEFVLGRMAKIMDAGQ